MNSSLRPILAARQRFGQLTWSRSIYYKFKREKTPPLQEPKESPYIVGPYLKPDYLPTRYITEPIRPRFEDDFDYFIYEPIKVEPDESRKVKLLLIKDVEGLGIAGQVVETSYRHGASNLIARRKAEYATDFTAKWYKFGPKTAESASTALSPRTVRLLRSQVFKLPISSNVAVKPWHIGLALRLSGCLCPLQAIDQNSISVFNENDEQLVKSIIRINNHERVEVKFSFAKKLEKENLDDD